MSALEGSRDADGTRSRIIRDAAREIYAALLAAHVADPTVRTLTREVVVSRMNGQPVRCGHLTLTLTRVAGECDAVWVPPVGGIR